MLVPLLRRVNCRPSSTPPFATPFATPFAMRAYPYTGGRRREQWVVASERQLPPASCSTTMSPTCRRHGNGRRSVLLMGDVTPMVQHVAAERQHVVTTDRSPLRPCIGHRSVPATPSMIFATHLECRQLHSRHHHVAREAERPRHVVQHAWRLFRAHLDRAVGRVCAHRMRRAHSGRVASAQEEIRARVNHRDAAAVGWFRHLRRTRERVALTWCSRRSTRRPLVRCGGCGGTSTTDASQP